MIATGLTTCALFVGSTTSARRSAFAQHKQARTLLCARRALICRAEGDDQQPSTPPEAPAAAPQADAEEPIWVRRERERELSKKEGPGDLPFGLYLLFSSFVAIAAIGSIFEYTAQKPIFDIVYPDSPLYVPILGLFAVTGLPTSGFLFYKAVTSANKEAERMDKLDGY